MTGSRSAVERFTEKVQHDDTGCWLWTGFRGRDGYGRFWLDGVKIGAHRASWTLSHGPIPTGMYVCHTCDVRACVNPAHLWLGTQAENLRDATDKRRMVAPPMLRGERAHMARLTESQVRAIRVDGRAQRAIARDYGVTHKAIAMILDRRSWAWLD